MSENNKIISIDIEINASGQQQINQYKAAFEGLKKSINNLSNPVSQLNGDIAKLTGSIGQLNSQTGSISDAAIKIKGNFEALGDIFGAVKSGMDMLKAGTLTLTTALTGGLSILLTFAPEIISLVSSFFKGKEAVAQMTDKMKGFNEIIKTANSDTAAQTTKLNLLYKSATDLKESDEDTVKMIKLCLS